MKLLLLLFLLVSCSTREIVPVTTRPGTIICSGTKMIGWTHPGTMTAKDKAQYRISKKRCRQKFRNSPCLASLEKRMTDGEVSYWAICGEPKYRN